MPAPTVCCLAVAPQAARHSGTLASRQPPSGPRHLRRVPEQQPQRRRGPRLQQPTAAAGSGSDSGDAAESPDAAFATCQSCMDMFCERQQSSDLDTIVAYLPDTVIDRLIERKRSKLSKEGGTAAALSTAATADDLSFEELVALAQPSDLALDSYSTRGVLNAAPRSAAVLSSLKLAPERFLQRYSVVADSGEEMTLTFAMGLEECLLPKYRGLQVVKRWFLKGITGEQAHPGNLPLKPDPRWGPEAVCLAQLEALQAGNAAGVLRFASPQNQAATGPPERFAQMLQSPQYRPLLQHQQAELLRSVQMKPGTAVLIVGVRSNIPTSEPGIMQRMVYSWTLRLQGPEVGDTLHNCWMTEAVQPISQTLFGGSPS